MGASIVVREDHCSCVDFNVATRPTRPCCLGQHESPAGERLPQTPMRYLTSGCVVLLQDLLDLSVFLLDGDQGFLDQIQALLLVRLVRRSRLVLQLSVVLDLLAAVLHLRESECRRGTLQEVAERREFCKIFVLAMKASVPRVSSDSCPAYSALSIFANVCSACSKNPKTMERLNSRSSSSSSISTDSISLVARRRLRGSAHGSARKSRCRCCHRDLADRRSQIPRALRVVSIQMQKVNRVCVLPHQHEKCFLASWRSFCSPNRTRMLVVGKLRRMV